jgi:hypothetical protein
MVERPPWFRGVTEGGNESPQELLENIPPRVHYENSTDLEIATKNLATFTNRLHRSLVGTVRTEDLNVQPFVKEWLAESTTQVLYEDLYESLENFREWYQSGGSYMPNMNETAFVLDQKAILSMLE